MEYTLNLPESYGNLSHDDYAPFVNRIEAISRAANTPSLDRDVFDQEELTGAWHKGEYQRVKAEKRGC